MSKRSITNITAGFLTLSACLIPGAVNALEKTQVPCPPAHVDFYIVNEGAKVTKIIQESDGNITVIVDQPIDAVVLGETPDQDLVCSNIPSGYGFVLGPDEYANMIDRNIPGIHPDGTEYTQIDSTAFQLSPYEPANQLDSNPSNNPVPY